MKCSETGFILCRAQTAAGFDFLKEKMQCGDYAAAIISCSAAVLQCRVLYLSRLAVLVSVNWVV